jgi:recombination protein RecA
LLLLLLLLSFGHFGFLFLPVRKRPFFSCNILIPTKYLIFSLLGPNFRGRLFSTDFCHKYYEHNWRLAVGIADIGVLDVVEDFGKERKTVKGLSSSTGSVRLDRALGGKLPSGAIEIYGDASVGKTTLLNAIMAQAQATEFSVALCPSEYLDLPYMRTCGVDLNSLALITGNYGEDVLHGAHRFIEANKGFRCLLAIDSATGLRPEVDHPGCWKAMLCVFLETVLPELSDGSCIVMTNQVRMRKSIDPGRMFVGEVVDSTAKSVIDLFSARLELERQEVMIDRYEMAVKVVSSIFSVPSRVIYLPVVKGRGVHETLDLLRLAADLGVVEKAGSWYKWRECPLGQGEQAAAIALAEHQAIAVGVLDDIERGA